MKARVFHFVLDHRVGGPHIYVRNLAQALASEIESTLVTTGQGDFTDIALVNLRHFFRLLYPLEVVINALLIYRRFWRKREREDVVFDVHGAANLAPILAARILDIPLVWHFHETMGGYSRLVKLGKVACSSGRYRYVVVARKAAEIFELTNAELIPGAVDTEFWASSSAEVSSENALSQFQILMVGNLNPLKGADILLTTLEHVSRPCEVTIIGAELKTHLAYAEKLRNQASRLENKGHNIQFGGWQSKDSIRSWMARADTFVLPSRSEACPLALLEAMAAGCACVAADVGDVGEILGNSKAGIVVPPDSPEALKEALEQVFALGLSGRHEMGQVAKEVAQERYSLKEQAAKHLVIYKELVTARKGIN